MLSFFTKGLLSVWFLLAQAFLSAFTWGSIWGLAIRNLGKHTKLGSALLLMTLISYALAPIIFGKLIDINPLNPNIAVLMIVPTYLFLYYYGKIGYRIENWTSKI